MKNKFLALLLGATMVASLVGCGAKDTSTTSTSSEDVSKVDKTSTSEDSNGYGTLLVETDSMEVYANKDTLNFILEETDTESWEVEASFFNKEDMNNRTLEEDEMVLYAEWDEDNDSLYQLTMEENGEYECKIIHYTIDENDMFMEDGSYNLYFSFDGEINMDDMRATTAFANELPSLTYHAAKEDTTIVNDENSSSEEEYTMEEDELLLTIEGNSISIPTNYEGIKSTFSSYDMKLIDVNSSEYMDAKDDVEVSCPTIEFMKNEEKAFELFSSNEGILKDCSFDTAVINSTIDFSLNLNGEEILTNKMTKSDIFKGLGELYMIETVDNMLLIQLPNGEISITLNGENIQEVTINSY